MNTANPGAVFFLGTRAHYQVLTPPEPNACDVDIENANLSPKTVHSPSADLWNSNVGPRESDLDVKWRLKKRRPLDTSSEMILNDNDDCRDVNGAERADGETKSRKSKRGRVSVGHLLALLARRRRMRDSDVPRTPPAAPAPALCTFRNSCRCDECQSRYFECDDSDDDYTMSDDSQYSPQYTQQYAEQYTEQYASDVNTCLAEPREESLDEGAEDDEVFIDSPPADSSPAQPVTPPRVSPPPAEQVDDLNLPIAAGAPLLFDMLLHHPLTCAIQ